MAGDRINRRDFINRAGNWCLAGAAVTGTGLLLTGCGGGDKAEEIGAKPHNAIQAAADAVDPCKDLSGLSEGEVETRATFKYENHTSTPAKKCDNCQFWAAPTGTSACGTCTLVKGPINPNGTCISWVAPIPKG
jgi:hypothetical protein